MDVLLEPLGINQVDGVTLDVGVSSFQIDDAARGFSFQADGPLDMRMEGVASDGLSAADVVNTLTQKDLASLIYIFGEEKQSRNIARAIVEARMEKPLSRTGELAALIAGVVHQRPDRKQLHPATRTFQALRIYVNCELDGTVVVCTIDDEKGLVPVQTVRCYPDSFEGRGHPENLGMADLWGAEGCLSADGSHYYYVCRVHQSIAVFTVGPNDGKLRFSSRHALTAKSNARNLTLDPSGKYLLVASQDADCVECFRIDPGTGGIELAHTQHAPCAADVAVI